MHSFIVALFSQQTGFVADANDAIPCCISRSWLWGFCFCSSRVFFQKKIHFYWDDDYVPGTTISISTYATLSVFGYENTKRFVIRLVSTSRKRGKKQIRSKQRVLFTWNTNHQWPNKARTQNTKPTKRNRENEKRVELGVRYPMKR